MKIRIAMLMGVAGGAALALAGCSDAVGLSEEGQELEGVVRWFAAETTPALEPTWPEDASIVIEAPDTVQVGVPFDASVRTLGNSGCWEVARTDVENGPMLAEVTPVDRDRMSEGLVCTAVMVELVHALEVTFTAVGEAVIRVHGREVIGDDFHSGQELTVEKVVTVE